MGYMENSLRFFEWMNEFLFFVVYSKIEGVVWCSVFIIVVFFVIVGNVFIIMVFVLNKIFCKKSFLLVINMVCVDFVLGVLVMFFFIYCFGDFKLWFMEWGYFLNLFYLIVDIVCV